VHNREASNVLCILVQEGLAVASIVRDVVVEMTPPCDHNVRLI